MAGFLLFVLVVILVIRWAVLSNRYSELERRMNRLMEDKVDASRLASLVNRIWQLEKTVAELREERMAVVSQPAPPVVEQVAEAAPAEPAPSPEPVHAPPEEPVESATPPRMPEALPAFAPTFMAAPQESSRTTRTSGEWEALVGGNWLNKVGMFVLVMAIALFLGYSFSKMGPAGRSSIGLAISLGLLASGVALERRAEYVIFARGLMGGGWAGLYFTVYAMQAIAAAKVLDSPLLGGFLLLAVATGMVLHSLRYGAQALTGLAYFIAFATLAITPVTAFSVIALIPLAASLLLVAHRFGWSDIALFNVIATYATCASRGDSGAPLWSAQTVFAIYWLVFESFDVLRAHRHSNQRSEQGILTLNALGFGLLSYAKWSSAAPDKLYQLAAGVAVAYLASTILRIWLRPPASFAPSEGTLERILAGGYEGPVTLAAACSAATAALKLHGQTVNIVLLAEGELLFLAGLFFRQDYPRRLAGTLFAALGLKLLTTDMPGAGTVVVAGRTVNNWTPSAAFAAALFYFNRGIRRCGSSYGYAGSALVALILGVEVSVRYLGISWLLFGACLFAFGWWFRLPDFRRQGYGSGLLALCGVTVYQVQYQIGSPTLSAYRWISLAVTAATVYGAAICARRSAPDRLSGQERRALEFLASAAGTAASAALLWRTVPDAYLAPAWAGLTLALVLAGHEANLRHLRLQSYALATLTFCRAMGLEFIYPEVFTGASQRIAAGFVVVASLFIAQLVVPKTRDDSKSEYGARALFSLLSTCLATALLFQEVSGSMLTVAWGIEGAALLTCGFPLRDRMMRLSGIVLFLVCVGKLFLYDLRNLETLDRILSFFVLGVILVGVSWLYTRFRNQILRYW